MPLHLSLEDRWRIISLRLDQGMSPIRIAAIVNCSIRTVHNILQLFRNTNDVIEREGRGRAPLNNDDIQILRRLFYRYLTETAANVNNRFFQRTNRFVTIRTIRDYR
ncbi:unnamed protein product [Rotaria sordida]|uniref:Uncharacterized protein n=1 Tax=Rotaria sordida TaxID=392033 RepID=A0A819DGI2_9BILA|nr:unnamed protein product [Rotaria sordida]CAF3835204.1 unnamed protein product [Rotaria sordida]